MSPKSINTEEVHVNSTMRRLETNIASTIEVKLLGRYVARLGKIAIINKIWTSTYRVIQNTLNGALWEITLEIEEQSEQ